MALAMRSAAFRLQINCLRFLLPSLHSLRQGLDKIVTAGFLCRCNNFFVSGGRISKPYIVFNRIVKQKNILEYDTEIRVKLFGVNFPNINSADGKHSRNLHPKIGP